MATEIEWKLELVAVPVSDVDRARSFYVDQVGFHLDHDHQVNDNLRFVQLTPRGSGCSIAIGQGITQAAPGSVEGLQLVVTDIQQAHAELKRRRVEASDIESLPWGDFVPDLDRRLLRDLLTDQRHRDSGARSAGPIG